MDQVADMIKRLTDNGASKLGVVRMVVHCMGIQSAASALVELGHTKKEAVELIVEANLSDCS